MPEIGSLVIKMPDGRPMHLLLSKDVAELLDVMNYLQDVEIDRLYLAHVPELRHRWTTGDVSQETPLGDNCRLCKEPIYYWIDEFEQCVHCSCTIWLLPLNADGLLSIDARQWEWTVELARTGIREWLQRN